MIGMAKTIVVDSENALTGMSQRGTLRELYRIWLAVSKSKHSTSSIERRRTLLRPFPRGPEVDEIYAIKPGSRRRR